MELKKTKGGGAEKTSNGRVFYRNPLDAPKKLGDMKEIAKFESLAYSGDGILEHIFKDKRYKDIDTPLSKYCFPLGFGLDEHIRKLLANIGDGNALRVLDVGAGTCSQWKEIVLENKGKLEFSAVALSDAYVAREMLPFLKICAAEGMVHEFSHSSFDLIVTYAGMHNQGLVGIKASEWLLKPSGELIVTLSTKTMPEPEEIFSVCDKLELVRAASDKSGEAVTYWLRKKTD